MYFCWLHPLPATSCLSYVGTRCPGLASAVRSHFPSLQWVRHSLLSPPFPTPPSWAGVAWEESEKREEGTGSWCTCLVQRLLPPSLLPLCPFLPILAQEPLCYPGFVCASSQGRRWSQMGGGLGRGDGDSWADSGPLGRRVA